jgi:hypothetical protein
VSKYRRQQPASRQEHESTTWTYWISRDSLDGALSALCSLWNEKPLRTRAGARVVWSHVDGHLGNFRPDEILSWPAFHTYPETDMELLVVETRPSAAELAGAKKRGGVG